MKIGGFFDAVVPLSFSDVDGGNSDFDGIDPAADGEIHFTPSTIIPDHSIKLGVHIELEGRQSGDQIDESYVFASGSFGEIRIGSHNSVGYRLSVQAPHVPISIDPDAEYATLLTDFIPLDGSTGGVNVGDDYFRGTLGTTLLENARNNDADRISYVRGRKDGLQLGISYARDGLGDFSLVNCDGSSTNSSTCHFIDVAGNYEFSVDGYDLVVSGRYGLALTDSATPGGFDNPNVFGVGANINFDNLVLGGSYARQTRGGDTNGYAIDMGASVVKDRRTYAATLFLGNNVDDENAASNGGNDAKEETTILMLAATEEFQPGLHLTAWGAYATLDEDIGDNGGAGNDVGGFSFGVSLGVDLSSIRL